MVVISNLVIGVQTRKPLFAGLKSLAVTDHSLPTAPKVRHDLKLSRPLSSLKDKLQSTCKML